MSVWDSEAKADQCVSYANNRKQKTLLRAKKGVQMNVTGLAVPMNKKRPFKMYNTYRC